MKIIKKIFIIILFINIIVFTKDTMKSYAVKSTDDIIKGADGFIDIADENKVSISVEDTKNVSNTIYNILLTIGIIIAVLIATVLGAQYMLGAAEDKAEIAKSMIPFLIGCAIVFGAFGIWKAIINALS